MEPTENVNKTAGAPSALNVGLGFIPWVTWVRDTAILTTAGACIGFAAAQDMWPAWAMMAIGAWAHYGDAVIKNKRMTHNA